MGKLRQWFRKVFDRWVEMSFQRQANKLFAKHDVEIDNHFRKPPLQGEGKFDKQRTQYTEGDNT